ACGDGAHRTENNDGKYWRQRVRSDPRAGSFTLPIGHRRLGRVVVLCRDHNLLRAGAHRFRGREVDRPANSYFRKHRPCGERADAAYASAGHGPIAQTSRHRRGGGFSGVLYCGFAVLAAMPTLLVVVIIQVVQRWINFAIANPARHLFFTVVTREEKYKAKNLIDVVVYRGSDALSGWIFDSLQAFGL